MITMMPKNKLLRTVLGSAALLAVPASAAAVPETEVNDTFPGQPAVVGTTYNGALCLACGIFGTEDNIDFYHYTGLPAGGSFDLAFDAPSLFQNDTLAASLFANASTVTSSVFTTGFGAGGGVVHLTGTVPASGELVFGIGNGPLNGAFAFETYNVVLNVRAVPEPASVALLGVGLTALALDVARRRKSR